MKRIKHVGGGPALVVAVVALIAAVAGTALADREPTATGAKSAKKLAKQAKKKAKKANRKAKAAQSSATAALGAANAAQAAADSASGAASLAQGVANSAQGTADAAQDSADTALARSVKMSYRANENTPQRVILNVGGLVIRGSCVAGPDVSITASTTADDSHISIGTIDGNDNSHGFDGFSFDSSDTASLTPDDVDNGIQGTLTYRNASNDRVVTLLYFVSEDPTEDRCLAFGNATVL